jgi:hypothetical protein
MAEICMYLGGRRCAPDGRFGSSRWEISAAAAPLHSAPPSPYGSGHPKAENRDPSGHFGLLKFFVTGDMPTPPYVVYSLMDY